jgi:peptidoglycan/LPS O-acetylase OafA/YrhL
MSKAQQHFPMADAVKAFAAQLIVLHHLAWFGPMSDVVAEWSAFGALVQSWLAAYGRYAVAAFLATAGFLAAQSLAPRGLSAERTPQCLILQRYIRLVGPYAVALALAIASAMLARLWMTHDSIGGMPTVKQLIAHLLLLHDLLGFEALSAGVWYVAIDFQLYALLVVLVWGAGVLRERVAGVDFWGPLLVAGVALVSLFYFNRDDAWDVSALYFFGSYAFGVGCAWALRSRVPVRLLALVAMLGVAALLFDFRPRVAVALATALALGSASLVWRHTGHPLLASLSRHSYALFLVHFPVCLLMNALLHRFDPDDGFTNVLGLLLAWTLSNLASIYFHRYLEKPLARGWPSNPTCHVAR